MALSISVLRPRVTIRYRTGELLEVSVAVGGASQEKIIVELWSTLGEEQGRKQVAYPLNYQRTTDGIHIFSAAIPLAHSGNFSLEFRARTASQQFWEWAEIDGKRKSVELWVDPAWIYDAIVYNAFVRYFGAREVFKDGLVHRIDAGLFDDIKLELQRLHDMGVNVLYLNPVYMIGELYRNYNPHDLLPEYLQPGCPYSIRDYKSIDPELSFGRQDIASTEHPFLEFKKLVDEAHGLGIRVFMDLVFNHSAHDAVFQRLHPEWFLYKEDITSLEQPYIYPEEIKQGKPWGDARHTFCPYDHGYWWRDAAQLNWNNTLSYPEFIMPHVSANDPPQNPTIIDMCTYFKNVVKFWIKEFGVDGFRCDVAYRVPLQFWRECIIEARALAKELHPGNGSVDGEVVFIAEDYHVNIRGLLEAGFTACYGDYSNKLVSLTEITGYLDYMYNIGGEHFPERTFWFIFPECHDFHRTPKKIVGHLREVHADADLNANKSRWTMTACLPGIPMIFNGFEKIEWQPASLFSYSTVDWESDKDITAYITRVNHIRRKETVLQLGSYYYLHTSEGITAESRIFSFARIYQKEVIIVVVNIDIFHRADGVKVYLPELLPIDFNKQYVLIDLLNSKRYVRKGREINIILDPGESHIFKVMQDSVPS